jgi:hypothetical protein
MPSLTVGIEATQSGSGDPSPTNIRPISGWSACNVVRNGVNIWDEEWEVGAIGYANGQNVSTTDRIRSKNIFQYYRIHHTIIYSRMVEHISFMTRIKTL